MNTERILGETGEFAPRKVVGRARSASENLALVEDMAGFVHAYFNGTRIRIGAEGDYFPVRKTVGRPHAK